MQTIVKLFGGCIQIIGDINLSHFPRVSAALMLDVVTSCFDNINEPCYTVLSFVDLREAFNKVT